ncbi:amidohydrolase family protein [Labilibacter marinus]|uniref:amidohydrolase family protein n=1 Tax=Labilibacter marinus TaxID=1477105 RepID=UPI0008333241|nr:amidohydrolase family protein [Labilibacter marinus]
MNYLLVKNGFVVKQSAIITEDILVGGNKILQIGQGIERPTGETPVIDASGKYILPGAVDVNRHFLDLTSEEYSPEEINKLNQAEIYNGTTTMLDAVEDFYEKNYLYNIYKAKQKAKNNLIDYGFHLAFSDLKASMANAFDYSFIHEGISTLLLSVSLLDKVNINVLESIVKRAANYHLLIICDLLIPDVEKSSADDIKLNNPLTLQNHFEALSVLVELGINYNCPLMFLNVKYKEELEMIHDGLDNGGDFYVSMSMPFSINLSDKNETSSNEKLGELTHQHGLTPIKEEEVWLLVKDQRFLINPPSYNLNFEDESDDALVFNRPDKFFYLRNYLSMLYTVGVNEGNINILDLVDIVSTRPSKIMGLWPKKGVLQAGADADFVIWNPTFDRNLYCSMPTAEITPLKKYKLIGRPDFVFAKGRMVYNGESFYPKHSDGAFVFRTSPM